MTTTLATVDGLGPVRLRCLTEDEIREVVEVQGFGDQVAALIERGLVDPPLSLRMAFKLGRDPDLCARLHAAIQKVSWHG